MKTLETQRLYLRHFKESDAEALYKYASDARVGLPAGWPPHRNADESREVIRRVLMPPDNFAIILRDGEELIGCISLLSNGRGNLDMGEHEAELGYWIGAAHWGRALAPEAALCILRYGFEELELLRIWCGHYEGNLRSRRVMEKVGFTYHHTEREKRCVLLDEVRTEHFFCLSRERWKALWDSGDKLHKAHMC